MDFPRWQRRPLDPAEREMYAHDANGSVTLLSLLFFLWGAVSLLTLPTRAFDVPNVLQVLIGGPAHVYFIRTRHRPSTRAAVIFSTLVILYSLALLPWITVVWCRLGRPMEAFTVPEIGVIIMALVIPRYMWLGAVALALFTTEMIFAYAYARDVAPAGLIPITEPAAALNAALIGVAVLVLRERRRELARRHIGVQAETAALRKIGPFFTAVRDGLATQVALLSAELSLLRTERVLPPMERAVARLAGVSGKLGKLLEGELVPALTAGDTSDSLLEPVGPDASEAERLLLARDAHSGATVFAALLVLATFTGGFFVRTHLTDRDVLRLSGLCAVGLGLLLYLVGTRRRPSERRARWIVLTLFVVAITVVSVNQAELLRRGRPFEPFLGHKMLMVVLGLVAARPLGVGIALIVGTAAVALGLYVGLQFGAHRELISLVEPWVTLVFMAIGISVAVMYDQRLLASLRLLRAESQRSALQRGALMFLALRDQLNSPLQTLVVCAGQLGSRCPPEELERVHAAISRLVALSGEVAGLEKVIPSGGVAESFDAERELHRR